MPTLNVDSDGSKDYSSIGAALAAAQNGDLIRVYHSLVAYEELVTVDVEVTIEGADDGFGLPTVSGEKPGPNRQYNFDIQASNVVLRDLTCAAADDYGIFIGATSAVTYSSIRLQRLRIRDQATSNQGGVGVCATVSDVLVENCVIYDNVGAGVGAQPSGGGTVDNVRVVNCTIFGNGFGGVICSGDGPTNVRVTNCILHDNGNYQLQIDSSSEATFHSDHNCLDRDTGPWTGYWGGQNWVSFTDWTGASGQDGNSVNADPLYTNETSRDLTLQAGSPAIQAGTNSGAPATDVDNRPRAGLNHIGAYHRAGQGALGAALNGRAVGGAEGGRALGAAAN